ncbi:MAG TPA: hypothetical protein VGZ25_12885 [Gemmataceae bacterium]|nr:hypothetical protein [Gemmataceae bacterium]
MNTTPSSRFVLRDLPLAARLTIATFLICVGIGYLTALIQLHFQHASPGNLLPTKEDARLIFHGPTDKPVSTIERLVAAHEDLNFNATGQMSRAFTVKSSDWKKAINEKAKELSEGNRRGAFDKEQLDRAEEALRKERQGERQALLQWLQSGASKVDYEKDSLCPSDEMANQPITKEFLVAGDDGKAVEPRAVKIKSIIDARCGRCHAKDGDDPKAAEIPLDTFEAIAKYAKVKETGGMSLNKLAQTTHVHLLGFSMLYGLTGLLLTLTSYPGWLRFILGPWVLIAQVVDIACWWLARGNPVYADAIRFTGMAVGAGLFAQIVLTLFNLFGKAGKTVLLILVIAATCGATVVKERYLDPYLASEKANVAATE